MILCNRLQGALDTCSSHYIPEKVISGWCETDEFCEPDRFYVYIYESYAYLFNKEYDTRIELSNVRFNMVDLVHVPNGLRQRVFTLLPRGTKITKTYYYNLIRFINEYNGGYAKPVVFIEGYNKKIANKNGFRLHNDGYSSSGVTIIQQKPMGWIR